MKEEPLSGYDNFVVGMEKSASGNGMPLALGIVTLLAIVLACWSVWTDKRGWALVLWAGVACSLYYAFGGLAWAFGPKATLAWIWIMVVAWYVTRFAPGLSGLQKDDAIFVDFPLAGLLVTTLACHALAIETAPGWWATTLAFVSLFDMVNAEFRTYPARHVLFAIGWAVIYCLA